MKKVNIYTDGACSGNPGPGGFGIVLEYKGRTKEFSKGFKHTTNNRMELLAVITALEMLKEPCEVVVTSDSKYVVDAVNKGWIYTWEENGWVKSDKKPVLNVDLWEHLSVLLEVHEVTFNWIEGHNGHPENELCDKLAVNAYKSDDLEELDNSDFIE